MYSFVVFVVNPSIFESENQTCLICGYVFLSVQDIPISKGAHFSLTNYTEQNMTFLSTSYTIVLQCLRLLSCDPKDLVQT